MTITVEAIYENGQLKLAEPIAVAEGAKVQVTLTTSEAPDVEEQDGDPLEAVIGICDEGPPVSLAAAHDQIVYGLDSDGELP
jgi:predicted DNA-binding antitoxin AbrB/MazE fold protein